MADNPILRFFDTDHLPDDLAAVADQFGVLARYIDVRLPACAETSTALRKLLEAKDCAVRAATELPPNSPLR